MRAELGSWADVTHAGAFLLGAVLAVVATLRVMRSIGAYFGTLERRPLPRRRPPDDSPREAPDE